MRRLVAIGLVMASVAVLGAAGITPAATAAAGPGPFPDVPADHPFAEDIVWLVAEGITEGFPDGTFGPARPITRQGMAAFLHRYAGSPAGDDPTCSEAPFPDVPVDHVFCGEIAWLVDEGVTTGFGDGTFRPGGVITRQGMAAFLYRFVGAPDGDDVTCSEAPFPDVAAVHVFCGEIAWLVETAITEGFDDGTFRPGAPITRQAMAAFLHRLRLWQEAQAGEPVAWRFDPGAVLIGPGESAEVRLVGVDVDGEDTTAPPPAFTLDSIDEELVALEPADDGTVTITAGTGLGVGLTTATVDGAVTDPLTVTVADVADGVVEVPDEQIFYPPSGEALPPGIDATAVGPFTWEEIEARTAPGATPDSYLSEGTRLPYVLVGPAPAVGTVLVGTGATGLMGQVVTPTGLPSITRPWLGGELSLVSVEVVPFPVAFDAIQADLTSEDLDAIGATPDPIGDFCDPETDPECDPTPVVVPGDPVVTPYTGPTADDPDGSGSDGAAGGTTAVAAPTAGPVPADGGGQAETEFTVAGMQCKASPTFSPANLKLESFQPNFVYYLVLRIDVGTEVAPYVRFEGGGRASPRATFSVNLQATGGGQVECEVGSGLTYVAPIKGPWALVAPAVKLQPTIEGAFSISGGPSLRTQFAMHGDLRVHKGFSYDPQNRYGQNPDHWFRPISLIDGPHFEMTPTSARVDAGVGDGSPWTYEVTGGAYLKIEVGIQLGGEPLQRYLQMTGRSDTANELFTAFGNFKAGIRARATYESDGVVLNSKATNSFVGVESDIKITIEPEALNDLLKLVTNGSVSVSLEIPIPSPVKLPLFQPVVMKDPVITVDGAAKEPGTVEVAAGQTLAVRTEVDPAKTFSFTGSLADGTLWEPGTLSHTRSDVIDLRANAGTPGSTAAYLDGQVTVTDELCEQWREPTPYKMLAVTRFDAAVGSIDTPSWAGEFTVKCIDPGIHFDPTTLSASGVSTLKATALPPSNRDWEITSPLPEWLTASAESGTFSSADDAEAITFTIEEPEIDCDTGPVTLTTVVVASAGEHEGEELDALLTISQAFDPGPECEPPPDAGPGGAWGDPHMVTLDGIAYEGQVFGEYVYLEPRAGGDGLRVHARHESSAIGMVHGAKVTSVTAVGIEVGDHVVEAYLRPETTYFVDGDVWEPGPNETLDLGGDVSLAHVGGALTLTTPTALLSLREYAGADIYDLFVTTVADGSLHGMLGIPDGEQANDRTRRDGEVEPSLDGLDAIHRFTDSWWIGDLADSLLTSQPLANRYAGDDRYPQPITDEELAPTIAEVAAAINPPVCTLDGPGEANFDQLVRNLALDRYVWGRPLGDLAGYGCTYQVSGSVSVDLGPGVDPPVAGLVATVSASGFDDCQAIVASSGQYGCSLRPAAGTSDPPDLPLVATVTMRWPGSTDAVATTTASFQALAPFMTSVTATADLVLGPEAFVILDISGSIVRDGVPESVSGWLTVETDAPPGDPSSHSVTGVTSESDGAWSHLLVATDVVTAATATLTIDEGGVPMTFAVTVDDLAAGVNEIPLDAIYDRVALDVSGTVLRDGVPYVGPVEVSFVLRDAEGAQIGSTTRQATTGADGAYAASALTGPTVSSADIRLRIYEDTGPVDFTLTAEDLVPGSNPIVLDASYERVQVTVSGRVVKDGAPLPGPLFLAVHSYSGPYTTFFDTTYLGSSGYPAVADADGDYEVTVLLPEGTRQVGLRVDVDGQSFPLDHVAVLPGQDNPVTLDVDASQPTLALSGTIVEDGVPFTEQFNVSIYAYKANPGGGDPIYFWPSFRSVTADSSGNWSLDEVLPRETVHVRVRVQVGEQWREIESPLAVGVNPVTFDVDLTQPTVDLSGVVSRNGSPLDTNLYLELQPYVHNPGGTPEWFALDRIEAWVDTDVDGSYTLSRDLPPNANHVVVTAIVDQRSHQLAVDVVGGANPVTFDIADDRPVLDISGSVVDEAGSYQGELSVTVFAYREPDVAGDDPVFLFFADATTVTTDQNGHYLIDSVVLPPETTRVRLSAGVHGTAFEQWATVDVGGNVVVFDMDASRTLLDVSGTLVKNGEGLNVSVPLTIAPFDVPGPGEDPVGLGEYEVWVDPVDGWFELTDHELPEETDLVQLSMSFGGQGTLVEVTDVGPGTNSATFDLDVTTAELRLQGQFLHEDGSPFTEPVQVLLWPDDDQPPDPENHPDAVSFEISPESDGSYLIEGDLPPETTRIGVQVRPTENLGVSTAFDASPGLNWYGMDWTFTRPLIQLDATVTVDGAPYTGTLDVDAQSWNLTWLANEYSVEWDEEAGAFLLDARLPLGSTGGLIRLSILTGGMSCRVDYELPSIDWWETTPLDVDWAVDTGNPEECFLLG